MTLGVGASCPEGAVIAADSMLFVGNPPSEYRVTSKVCQLPHWRGAYVTYGAWAEPGRRDTFIGTVMSIQSRITSLASYIAHDPHEQAATLAAGTENGHVCLVICRDKECIVAPREGAIYLLGYATTWAGSLDPPTTLDACAELALKVAQETIEREYAKHGATSFEGCLAAGKVPGVAFPIDLVILRPGRLEIHKCRFKVKT